MEARLGMNSCHLSLYFAAQIVISAATGVAWSCIRVSFFKSFVWVYIELVLVYLFLGLCNYLNQAAVASYQAAASSCTPSPAAVAAVSFSRQEQSTEGQLVRPF
jgi:hypothetical protein